MGKAQLKRKIVEERGANCEISGEALPVDTSLYDTHRDIPKALGGTYEGDNTKVVLPFHHMAHHESLRTREGSLDELKTAFDDRVQTMKLLLKIENQLRAYERKTDHKSEATSAWLKSQIEPVKNRLKEIDKELTRRIKEHPDNLAQSALSVKGLGPITVAALTAYVQIEKAATPSALWKYCGLDKASHERYEKDTSGGGNKTLWTVLYNAACVMMKLGEGPYREVYDRTKTRLAQSEKITKTRNTQGKLIEAKWKDTKDCHRHGAALRAVMKHLLADYWRVGREIAGLSTRGLYSEDMLGHTHIVRPEERGWKIPFQEIPAPSSE